MPISSTRAVKRTDAPSSVMSCWKTDKNAFARRTIAASVSETGGIWHLVHQNSSALALERPPNAVQTFFHWRQRTNLGQRRLAKGCLGLQLDLIGDTFLRLTAIEIEKRLETLLLGSSTGYESFSFLFNRPLDTIHNEHASHTFRSLLRSEEVDYRWCIHLGQKDRFTGNVIDLSVCHVLVSMPVTQHVSPVCLCVCARRESERHLIEG